jgi:hypothetical protein
MHVVCVSQHFHIFLSSSVIIIILKVLSAVNILAPVIFSNVRKCTYTHKRDRVTDVPHTQPVYYSLLEEYASSAPIVNFY